MEINVEVGRWEFGGEIPFEYEIDPDASRWEAYWKFWITVLLYSPVIVFYICGIIYSTPKFHVWLFRFSVFGAGDVSIFLALYGISLHIDLLIQFVMSLFCGTYTPGAYIGYCIFVLINSPFIVFFICGIIYTSPKHLPWLFWPSVIVGGTVSVFIALYAVSLHIMLFIQSVMSLFTVQFAPDSYAGFWFTVLTYSPFVAFFTCGMIYSTPNHLPWLFWTSVFVGGTVNLILAFLGIFHHVKLLIQCLRS